jgi:hypothetical protein
MWAVKANRGLIVKSLLVALAVILVVVGVYFGFIKKSANQAGGTQANINKPATPTQIAQGRGKRDTASLLAAKDYSGYQVYQRILADQFVGFKQYSQAAGVMGQVRANVPLEQIDGSSYNSMAQIAGLQKDTANQKKYIQLAIDTFNKQSRSAEATQDQQWLDSLK